MTADCPSCWPTVPCACPDDSRPTPTIVHDDMCPLESWRHGRDSLLQVAVCCCALIAAVVDREQTIQVATWQPALSAAVERGYHRGRADQAAGHTIPVRF